MEFIQYVAAAGLGSCHRAWSNRGRRDLAGLAKLFETKVLGRQAISHRKDSTLGYSICW